LPEETLPMHLPMLFSYDESASYFEMKVKSGNMQEAIASVKTAWDRVFPDNVFSYFFLNERL
jgi:putative ABC transport system permease protein